MAVGGLMPGRMPPGGGAPPPGPEAAPGPEAQGRERRQPTEAEQRLFDDFVGNAIKLAYEPETADRIVDLLRGGPATSPVEGLAQVTAMVVGKVKESAEQAGNPVPDAIVVRCAAKVASDIGTEMAPAAGLPQFDDEQIHAAYFRAMEILREEKDAAAAAPPEGGAEPPAPGPAPGNGLMPGRQTP